MGNSGMLTRGAHRTLTVDRLFFSPFDGTTWATQATFDGTSSVGPSLAVQSGLAGIYPATATNVDIKPPN